MGTIGKFRFELTRQRMIEEPDGLFAGRRLRNFISDNALETHIYWRDDPACLPNDMLVIKGLAETEVIAVIQAYIMGHDYRMLMDRYEGKELNADHYSVST